MTDAERADKGDLDHYKDQARDAYELRQAEWKADREGGVSLEEHETKLGRWKARAEEADWQGMQWKEKAEQALAERDQALAEANRQRTLNLQISAEMHQARAEAAAATAEVQKIWNAVWHGHYSEEFTESVHAALKRIKDGTAAKALLDKAKKMIRSIFLFPNGMLAVCDEKGEQMPDYQGRDTAELRAKIGRQLERQASSLQPEFNGCSARDFDATRIPEG